MTIRKLKQHPSCPGSSGASRKFTTENTEITEKG